MIFVIIELAPRMRFNPFRAQTDELFNLYNEVKSTARTSRTSFISHYTSYDKMQERIGLLNAQLTRFIVLEMLLENHFQIANRPAPFVDSIASANFYIGGLQRPIPRMSRAEAKRDDSAPTATNTDPFAQVPKPAKAIQDEAEKVAGELGDDKLPQECCDPISMLPLTDPIEINKRVYNRETAANMVKNGKFEDPFNRNVVELATAKPAHYMLDAIVAHRGVMEGKEPAMLGNYKNTDVYPLRDLIDVWEKLLHDFHPKPVS